jgi:hypothetical protein
VLPEESELVLLLPEVVAVDAVDEVVVLEDAEAVPLDVVPVDDCAVEDGDVVWILEAPEVLDPL